MALLLLGCFILLATFVINTEAQPATTVKPGIQPPTALKPEGQLAIPFKPGPRESIEGLGATYAPNADPDGDGLPNSWERIGVDINNDGRIDLNLPRLGANPLHKDIFVEVDYMQNHKPNNQAISDVVARFARAPVSSPDSPRGITLHVLVDEQIPHQATTDLAGLQKIKNDNFGTAAERADPNHSNIISAKSQVFHYCAFVHAQPGSTSSGSSFFTPNMDFIVSLGATGWGDSDGNGHTDGSIDQQEGTFMHELGHNLNLKHGGNEELPNYKPNYLSVMNYLFQMSSIVASRPLDYSVCVASALDENSLSEPIGIGPSCPPSMGTFIESMNLLTKIGVPIDYNGNGDGGKDLGVRNNLNNDLDDKTKNPIFSILNGYSDWANIVYNLRTYCPQGLTDKLYSEDLYCKRLRTMETISGGTPLTEPEYSVENLRQDRLSLLAGIERQIQTLPATAFKTPEAANQVKGALSQEITTSPTESIATALNAGNLNGAIQELTELKARADSSMGGAAADDLIVAPQAQQTLTFLIDNLIQTLQKQK